MSFSDLPSEIVEMIIRKTFIKNITLRELRNVSKQFRNIIYKYFDISTYENYRSYRSTRSKTHRICRKCDRSCTNHINGCPCAKILIRGIKGICYKCLSYNIFKHKCEICKIEFMSTAGKSLYCYK